MEAKDTAKHQDNCELSHIKINFGRCTCGAEQQAEISFKAGKSETYQDLFNWANKSCPHQFYSTTKHRCKTCWDELRERVYKEASPV